MAQNLNIIRKLVMNLLKGLDLPVATKKKNLTIGNKQTLCSKNEKVECRVLTKLPKFLADNADFRRSYIS